MAIVCEERSRLFDGCNNEFGNDADNCDWDCWVCWVWGRIVNDGVGVRFVAGETVDGLGFKTESEVVDWRRLDDPLRSAIVGLLLISSCVSQIIERSTSQAKSAVELQVRLV